MARRPSAPTTPPPPPQLLMPHNEARDRLIARREAGNALAAALRSDVKTEQAFEEGRAAYGKWHDFNVELLRRMFDQPEYANEFASAGSMSLFYMERHWTEEFRDFLERFRRKIDYLDGLAERIELIDLASGVSDVKHVAPQPIGPRIIPTGGTKVFVVHGRDEEAKSVVARFLERCHLKPIILHEQADQGRTIIEKFEQESDVGFAVVLLTPDDVGGINEDNPTLLHRSRQNVILELGYFVGKLGRDRVCAFKKGDIELPSDFSGVLYTPFGADESWKIRLGRELRAAGFEVDLNTALG